MRSLSGIEWYAVEYGGITAELPRLYEDLTLISGDKEILMQSKPLALEFLAHWKQVFKLWRYDKDNCDRWTQIRWDNFYTQYLRQEWLEIWVDDYISPVILQDGSYQEQPTGSN